MIKLLVFVAVTTLTIRFLKGKKAANRVEVTRQEPKAATPVESMPIIEEVMPPVEVDVVLPVEPAEAPEPERYSTVVVADENEQPDIVEDEKPLTVQTGDEPSEEFIIGGFIIGEEPEEDIPTALPVTEPEKPVVKTIATVTPKPLPKVSTKPPVKPITPPQPRNGNPGGNSRKNRKRGGNKG
jgi:hypothetical protein